MPAHTTFLCCNCNQNSAYSSRVDSPSMVYDGITIDFGRKEEKRVYLCKECGKENEIILTEIEWMMIDIQQSSFE